MQHLSTESLSFLRTLFKDPCLSDDHPSRSSPFQRFNGTVVIGKYAPIAGIKVDALGFSARIPFARSPAGRGIFFSRIVSHGIAPSATPLWQHDGRAIIRSNRRSGRGNRKANLHRAIPSDRRHTFVFL